jgi:hypothetical protein
MPSWLISPSASSFGLIWAAVLLHSTDAKHSFGADKLPYNALAII